MSDHHVRPITATSPHAVERYRMVDPGAGRYDVLAEANRGSVVPPYVAWQILQRAGEVPHEPDLYRLHRYGMCMFACSPHIRRDGELFVSTAIHLSPMQRAIFVGQVELAPDPPEEVEAMGLADLEPLLALLRLKRLRLEQAAAELRAKAKDGAALREQVRSADLRVQEVNDAIAPVKARLSLLRAQDSWSNDTISLLRGMSWRVLRCGVNDAQLMDFVFAVARRYGLGDEAPAPDPLASPAPT